MGNSLISKEAKPFSLPPLQLGEDNLFQTATETRRLPAMCVHVCVRVLNLSSTSLTRVPTQWNLKRTHTHINICLLCASSTSWDSLSLNKGLLTYHIYFSRFQHSNHEATRGGGTYKRLLHRLFPPPLLFPPAVRTWWCQPPLNRGPTRHPSPCPTTII